MYRNRCLVPAIKRLSAACAAILVIGMAAVTNASAASYDWHFRPPGVTVYFNKSETRWIAGGSKLAGFDAATRFLTDWSASRLWYLARAYANYLYYYRGQCLWIDADVTKSFNYGGWRC